LLLGFSNFALGYLPEVFRFDILKIPFNSSMFCDFVVNFFQDETATKKPCKMQGFSSVLPLRTKVAALGNL
jgi:hypothetical protein